MKTEQHIVNDVTQLNPVPVWAIAVPTSVEEVQEAMRRDSVVATFLTNPLFTRRLLQGFIDDPARATDAWVALYQRPLGVEGTTAAVGAWLPALIGPSTGAASENPATYRALTIPVYLIWGERDRITPLAQGEELARLVPGAELTVIKEVGHIPQIEDAAAFNEVLGKVIAKATSMSGKP